MEPDNTEQPDPPDEPDEPAAPEVLRGLNEHQVAAVTSDGAPLLVLAGPGSGKTRVLTHRIAWRAQQDTLDANRTMAVTFTRRAALEMRNRLNAMGVRKLAAVGTFHGLALAQLRRFEDERDLPPRRLIGDRKDLLNELISEWRHKVRGPGPQRDVVTQPLSASELDREIEWGSAMMLTPDAYAGAPGKARVRDAAGWVKQMWGRYERLKRKRNFIDYADILAGCRYLMTHDEQFAAAQRWRFEHFFVDEFQDLNRAQFALVRAWLGDRIDLFAVGDPDQAIYEWNGADASFTTQFRDHFPTATILSLEHNYRSTEVIQAAAAAVLGRTREWTSGKPPTVLSFADDDSEASGIADYLKTLVLGSARSPAWAVLARANKKLDAIAAILEERGVPYRRLQSRAWRKRPATVALLRVLRHADGRLADALVLADEIRAEGEYWHTGIYPAERPADELAHDDETPEVVPFEVALDRALARCSDAVGEPPKPEQMRLLELAADFVENDPRADGKTFAAWFGALQPGDDDSVTQQRAAVDLATIHVAKGLEWPSVIIASASKLADDGPASEETRVAYVAMSRAKERIVLSCPRTDTPPSWLADIVALSQPPRVAPDEVERGLSAVRQKLADTPDAPASRAERHRAARRRAERRRQSEG